MIRLLKDDALEELEAERREQSLLGICTMCHLASPSSDTPIIAESEHGVVVLDGFAATAGHLLVIARQHLERPADIPWVVYSDLQHLVWRANRCVEEVLRPVRVYTAALGSAAPLPMSFPHFHVHVVPIYTTDEEARPARVFSWSSGVVRYEPGEAEQLAHDLRQSWASAA
jgi:histidine triad (HIT) family protein